MTITAVGNLDLRVERVRKAFLDGRKRAGSSHHCTLSFGDFLRAFRGGRQSFAELAARGGVSREAVRRIFAKYFRDLFPGRRHWMHERRNRRDAQRFRDSLRPPEDSHARRVYTEAKKRGLSVKQVRVGDHPLGSFRRNELLIDGARCAIHRIRSSYTPHNKTRGVYGRLTVTRSCLKKVDFNIIVVDVDAFRSCLYVIPSTVLLDVLVAESNQKTFYIPLRTPRHRGKPSRITWKVYEDAWFFIKSRPR